MSLSIIQCTPTNSAHIEYLKEIKDLLISGKRLILVVPDKFSYIAEKRICEAIGGTGLNGVEILTFHQFARQVAKDNKLLSTVGKQILIKKIIDRLFDENNIFYASKNKQGFIAELLSVISLWKSHCVNADDITAEADKLTNETLKEKIHSIADVFVSYCQLVENSSLTDDSDELFIAAKGIKEDSSFRGSYVWFDEFTELSPSELEIVSAFLSQDAHVKFYLKKPDSETHPSDIQMYNDLVMLCDNLGVKCSTQTLTTKKDLSYEIEFLCSTYNDDNAVLDRTADNISIAVANDIYSETEFAASNILSLIQDEGYNYSNIAVMCGNLSDYASCIEAVFDSYKIPYFSDYKLSLSSHPVAILLSNVFKLIKNLSFPLSAMVRYLKTGYITKSADDTDLMTRFAKKHRIKGSMWLEPKYFALDTSGYFDAALGKKVREIKDGDKLLDLREQIIMPLVNYHENSKGIKTINEHIKLFFKYIEEINLFQSIENQVDAIRQNGFENDASRLTHVWNILVEIFNQMSSAVGNEKVDVFTFGEYFNAAVESTDISIIPSVTNGVSVSDIGKRNGCSVKALFILGATADTVPKVQTEDGLISEYEASDINSIPKTSFKTRFNKYMEFDLQQAIADTTEKLYLSMSTTDISGGKLEKSPLFDLLSLKFPHNKILTENDIKKINYISSPQDMMHRLLVKMTYDDVLSKSDEYAMQWFLSKDDYKNQFDILNTAVSYKAYVGSISKATASELYKDITEYSISRLEKYFRCPFSYFANYGLKLEDEKDNGMQSTDTGSLIHYAIAKMCKTVEEGATSFSEKKARWSNIEAKDCDKIMKSILDEIKSGLTVDKKLENLFDRVYKTLTAASRSILTSINKGKYGILNCELDFSGFQLSTDRGEIAFRGIIDRVDGFSENGKNFMRVIDYKTGEKNFNAVDVLNGDDLQLIIYAMAAKEKLNDNISVTGMFYNSLKSKIENAKSESEGLAKVHDRKKLSGSVFADRNEKYILSTKTSIDMDEDLEVNYDSSYLPVNLKKNGEYSSKSKVLSDNMFDKISKYVKDLVIEGSENIKDGDVRVYPLYGNNDIRTACKYCPHANLCMYDIENGALCNDGSRGKETFDKLKEEEEND